MKTIENGIEIPVSADISGFSDAMKDMQVQSKQFSSVFSSTIKTAIISGKGFEETLKSLALKISNVALSAGLRPLEKATSNLVGNFVSGLTSSLTGGSSGASIVPFAKGGIVSSPSFFGGGRQVGLMGEAGAEAILPLARGSDGRLGVRTEGGGQPTNIVFNVSTPNVAGFKKSEAQISTMLARAAGRGRRGL